MTTFSDIPEAEIDRVFAGGSADSEQGAQIAGFADAVAAAYPETSTSTLEAAHLRAMLAAAAQADPSASPAASSPRARGWLSRVRAHKWAAAVSLTLAALLAYGGAAYAGVLPAPLQEATSTLASDVGIRVPRTSALGPGGQSAQHRSNPSGTDAGRHLGLVKRGISAPGASAGASMTALPSSASATATLTGLPRSASATAGVAATGTAGKAAAAAMVGKARSGEVSKAKVARAKKKARAKKVQAVVPTTLATQSVAPVRR